MHILIVDDHAVVRAGTKLLMQGLGDRIVFDEAGSGSEALQKLSCNRYDVVLLDMSLPDVDGFEVLKTIKVGACPPVVIVSMHEEEQYAVKAYSLGADGYVCKSSAPAELVRAVEQVVQGKKYIGGNYMNALMSALQQNNTPGHSEAVKKSLSGREHQIAKMLATGLTNKEIAWELSINIKTVSTYKTRVLTKLGLKNLAELVKHMLFNSTTQPDGACR